jgi:hypothetical protein
MKTYNLKLYLVVTVLAFALGNFTGSHGPNVSLVPTAHAQTSNQKANFISNYRAVIDKVTAAMEAEKSLRSQYNALSLSSALADADFTGDNLGITKTQLLAAVTGMDAMQTAYGATVRGQLYAVSH